MEVENKPKVLVVDDVQSNIEFVIDVLELENLNVIGANNGKDAIRLTMECKPDLILLDISMPVMDGYEVCHAIKENKGTNNIPIIFLTARIQKEDIVRGFELGAVDYIVKPFNFNELISRVKTHIDLKIKTEQLKQINCELESKIEERTSEVRLANNKLKNAMEELSKLDKAKTEFVLHINHELRTPLNGILGYLNILEEQVTEETCKNHLESINSLTYRLIKVAELSLLFTELNIDEHQLDLEKVDLISAIMETLNNKELEQKNLEIELESSYEHLYVIAEPKLLVTCISIVFDNAVKYSPQNSYIKVKAHKVDDFIEYSVTDNGPGFSEKALKEVFNFLSADNLEHQSYGFGVGLATAKIILNLIGGKIDIKNEEEGACVKLSFKEFQE